MKLYQLLILAIMVSCSGRGKSPNSMPVDSLSAKEIEPAVIAPDESDFAVPEDTFDVARVALSFYKNYAKTVFEEMDEDSVVSLLHVDSYMERLEALGTLSERFLQQESARLDSCDRYLHETDWRDADHSSMYAYSEGPCEWLAYDYWYRSQEKPDKTGLVKLEIDGSAAVAEIGFYWRDSDGSYKLYETVKEDLILDSTSNQWHIDRITFSK